MLTPSPQAQELMKALTGMDWPSIDEDALREAAVRYEATAQDFDAIEQALDELARRINADFAGEAASRFAAYAALISGGDPSSLAAMKEQTGNLAKAARETATDAEYAKWMILAQLIELIAELLFLAAVWWVPFLGEAVAAETSLLETIVSMLVPKMIQGLVKSIALHTVMSAALGVAMDSLIQGIQMGQGNRDHWDGKLTLQALEYGAVQGVIGGALSLVGATLGMKLGGLIGKDFTTVLKHGLGEVLAKTAGSAGAEAAAKKLAKGLGNTLGELDFHLAKGLNKSAGKKFTDEFTTKIGKLFAQHGFAGAEGEAARTIGQLWAKDLVKEWAGAGSAGAFGAQVRHTLGKEAVGRAGAELTADKLLGTTAVKVLADEIPELLTKAGMKPDRRFLAGLYGTDMVVQGASQNLAEGAFNLITQGSFTTSGGTFLAGFLTTGIGHAGRHFLVHPAIDYFAKDSEGVSKFGEHLATLSSPDRGPLAFLNTPGPTTDAPLTAAPAPTASAPAPTGSTPVATESAPVPAVSVSVNTRGPETSTPATTTTTTTTATATATTTATVSTTTATSAPANSPVVAPKPVTTSSEAPTLTTPQTSTSQGSTPQTPTSQTSTSQAPAPTQPPAHLNSPSREQPKPDPVTSPLPQEQRPLTESTSPQTVPPAAPAHHSPSPDLDGTPHDPERERTWHERQSDLTRQRDAALDDAQLHAEERRRARNLDAVLDEWSRKHGVDDPQTLQRLRDTLDERITAAHDPGSIPAPDLTVAKNPMAALDDAYALHQQVENVVGRITEHTVTTVLADPPAAAAQIFAAHPDSRARAEEQLRKVIDQRVREVAESLIQAELTSAHPRPDRIEHAVRTALGAALPALHDLTDATARQARDRGTADTHFHTVFDQLTAQLEDAGQREQTEARRAHLLHQWGLEFEADWHDTFGEPAVRRGTPDTATLDTWRAVREERHGSLAERLVRQLAKEHAAHLAVERTEAAARDPRTGLTTLGEAFATAFTAHLPAHGPAPAAARNRAAHTVGTALHTRVDRHEQGFGGDLKTALAFAGDLDTAAVHHQVALETVHASLHARAEAEARRFAGQWAQEHPGTPLPEDAVDRFAHAHADAVTQLFDERFNHPLGTATATDETLRQWHEAHAGLTAGLGRRWAFELHAALGLDRWAAGFKEAAEGRGLAPDRLEQLGRRTRDEWFASFYDLWARGHLPNLDVHAWLAEESAHGGRFVPDTTGQGGPGASHPPGGSGAQHLGGAGNGTRHTEEPGGGPGPLALTPSGSPSDGTLLPPAKHNPDFPVPGVRPPTATAEGAPRPPAWLYDVSAYATQNAATTATTSTTATTATTGVSGSASTALTGGGATAGHVWLQFVDPESGGTVATAVHTALDSELARRTGLPTLGTRIPGLADALLNEPQSFIGAGKTMVAHFDTVGTARPVTVSAILSPEAGHWTLLPDIGKKSPYKFDTVHRTQHTGGLTTTESASRSAAVPLGLTGSPFGPAVQVTGAYRTTDGRKHTTTDQYLNQRETRSAEDAHFFVSHVHFKVELHGEPLAPVRGPQHTPKAPLTVGLGVENGLLVRAPESSEQQPTLDQRVPHSFTPLPDAPLGDVHVEGLGGLGDLGLWAAQHLGLGPSHPDFQSVLDHLSVRHFTEHAGELLTGGLDPRHGIRIGRGTLGTFHLVGVSTTHEIRVTDQFTMKNEIGATTQNTAAVSGFLGARAGGELVYGQAGVTGGLDRSTTHLTNLGGASGSKHVNRTKNSLTVLGVQELTFPVELPGGHTREVHTWALVRRPVRDLWALRGYDTREALRVGRNEPSLAPLLTPGSQHVDLSLAKVRTLTLGTGRDDPYALTDQVLDLVTQELGPFVMVLTREHLAQNPSTPWYRPGHALERAAENTRTIVRALRPDRLASVLDELHHRGLRIPLFGRGALREKMFVLTLHADLTAAPRYLGTDHQHMLRHSRPGTVRHDGGQDLARGFSAGAEGRLGLKAGSHDLSLSLAYRYDRGGVRTTRSGGTASREQMIATQGGAHHFALTGVIRGTLAGYTGLTPLPHTLTLGLVHPVTPVRPLGGPAPLHLPFTADIALSEQLLPDVPLKTGAPGPAHQVLVTVLDPAGTDPLGPPPTTTPDPLSATPLLTVKVHPPAELVTAFTAAVDHAAGGRRRELSLPGGPHHERAARLLSDLVLSAQADQLYSPGGILLTGLRSLRWFMGFEGTLRISARRGDLRPASLTLHFEPEQNIGMEATVSGSRSATSTHAVTAGLNPVLAQDGPGGPSLGGYPFTATLLQHTTSHTRGTGRSVSRETNLVQNTGHFLLVTGDSDFRIEVSGHPAGILGAVLKALRPGATTAGRLVHAPGAFKGLLTAREAHRLGIVDDTLGPYPGLGDTTTGTDPEGTGHGKGAWAVPQWTVDDAIGLYPLGGAQSSGGADAFQVLDDLLHQIEQRGVGETGVQTLHTLLSQQAVRSALQAGVDAVARGRAGRLNLSRGMRLGGKNVELRIRHERRAPKVVEFTGFGDIESTHTVNTTVDTGVSKTRGNALGLPGSERARHDPLTVGGTLGPASATRSATSSTTSSVTTVVTHLTAVSGGIVSVESDVHIEVDLVDADGHSLLTGPDGTAGPVSWRAGKQTDYAPMILLDPPGATFEPKKPSAAVTLYPGLSDPAALHAHLTHEDRANHPELTPGDGIHIKGVHGAEQVRRLARQLLTRAGGGGRSGLVQPGTAAAHALTTGTNAIALAGALSDATALRPGGHLIPGLFEDSLVGGSEGALTLHMLLRHGDAQILRVSDKVRLENLRGGGLSRDTARGGDRGLNVTAGLPFTVKGDTGSGSGTHTGSLQPQTGAGRSANLTHVDTEADQSRRNDKPHTGRAVLVSVPTTVLAHASVHRDVKDSALARHLGLSAPAGPRTGSTEIRVEMWISEDKARALGILTDDTFPPEVSAAWDAVTGAEDAFKAASTAYDDARRPFTDLAVRVRHDDARAPELQELKETRGAELHEFRAKFEAARATYEQVLAAALTLTRFAHARGRDGVQGPLPAPPVFTAPEKAPKLPDDYALVRDDTGEVSGVTLDGTTWQAGPARSDGNGLFHALAQALGDPTDARAAALRDEVLRVFRDTRIHDTPPGGPHPDRRAARLAEILATYHPDVTDVFTDTEIEQAGLGHLVTDDSEAGREYRDLHIVPMSEGVPTPEHASVLPPRRRLGLARVQAARDLATETAQRRAHAAADLFPALAAVLLDRPVTVLSEGRRHTFTPGGVPLPENGGSTHADELTVLLDNGLYRPLTPPATPRTDAPTHQEHPPATPQEQEPPVPSPAPVLQRHPVPLDGYCQISSVLVSAPDAVLRALPDLTPRARDLLADPARLRAAFAGAHGHGTYDPVLRELVEHVRDRVGDHLAALGAAGLVDLLSRHPDAATTLFDTFGTGDALLDAISGAVRNWDADWYSEEGHGEAFLPLLADAFGLQMEIHHPGRPSEALGHSHPPTATRVHVFLDNRHYTGMSPAPRPGFHTHSLAEDTAAGGSTGYGPLPVGHFAALMHLPEHELAAVADLILSGASGDMVSDHLHELALYVLGSTDPGRLVELIRRTTHLGVASGEWQHLAAYLQHRHQGTLDQWLSAPIETAQHLVAAWRASGEGPLPLIMPPPHPPRVNLPVDPATDAIVQIRKPYTYPETGFLVGALRSEGRAPGLGNLKEGGTLYVIGHDHQLLSGKEAADELGQLLGHGDRRTVKNFDIRLIVCQAGSRNARTISPAETLAVTLGVPVTASLVDITFQALDRHGNEQALPSDYLSALFAGSNAGPLNLMGQDRVHTTDALFDELVAGLDALELDEDVEMDDVAADVYDILSGPPAPQHTTQGPSFGSGGPGGPAWDPLPYVIKQPHYATGDQFGIAAALVADRNLQVYVTYESERDEHLAAKIAAFYAESPQLDGRVHVVKASETMAQYGKQLQEQGAAVPSKSQTRKHLLGVGDATRKIGAQFTQRLRDDLRTAWNVGPDPVRDTAIGQWLSDAKQLRLPDGAKVAVLWSRFSGKNGEVHIEHDTSYVGMAQIVAGLGGLDAVLVVGDSGPGSAADRHAKYRALADYFNHGVLPGTEDRHPPKGFGAKVVDLTEFWKDAGVSEWRGDTRTGQFQLFDYLHRHFDTRHLGFRSGNLEAMALMGFPVRYMEEPHSELGGLRMEAWHQDVLTPGLTAAGGTAPGYERLTVSHSPTRSGQHHKLAHSVDERRGGQKHAEWHSADKTAKHTLRDDRPVSRPKGFADEDLANIDAYLLHGDPGHGVPDSLVREIRQIAAGAETEGEQPHKALAEFRALFASGKYDPLLILRARNLYAQHCVHRLTAPDDVPGGTPGSGRAPTPVQLEDALEHGEHDHSTDHTTVHTTKEYVSDGGHGDR
ncbi:hypothetical protein ACH4C2_15280 [Streptomyces sp. NPDC018057]|uniref:WXG100-like domain-containing protein n=1 Tax=unclassified Streptomyces TaxID=2593676 RepID=UPI00379A1F88